ncbi:MAG: hypothetical protein ACRCWQ_11055 [Bacilli bacterium]
MTVKELVALFYDVDFVLYDLDTQEKSKMNPRNNLPDGEVSSISDAPYSEFLIINHKKPEVETFACCYCWADVTKEEIGGCEVCGFEICKKCLAEEDVKLVHDDGKCVDAPSRNN